jgi:hypothetical protein
MSMPINLFMAGNMLFYIVVIGKEGMSGWWYSYCRLFKNDWQKLGQQWSKPWMFKPLNDHAEQIAYQLINIKDICAFCGGIRGS